MAIAAVGLALARLVWQPPVLGYLIAGVIIGPYTLPHPVISNLDTIELLAELGLILLLFGIGLELGWRRIQEIGLRVLVIGVVEISTLTYLGVLIADKVLGISGANALYLGGAMAISSSAILLKGLRDSGNLRAGWGQTVVGILLVEDFAAVILLTLLAGIATTGSTDLADVGWLAAKLGIFCIAALGFGALLAPRLMRFLSRMQSDETLLVALAGLLLRPGVGSRVPRIVGGGRGLPDRRGHRRHRRRRPGDAPGQPGARHVRRAVLPFHRDAHRLPDAGQLHRASPGGSGSVHGRQDAGQHNWGDTGWAAVAHRGAGGDDHAANGRVFPCNWAPERHQRGGGSRGSAGAGNRYGDHRGPGATDLQVCGAYIRLVGAARAASGSGGQLGDFPGHSVVLGRLLTAREKRDAC